MQILNQDPSDGAGPFAENIFFGGKAAVFVAVLGLDCKYHRQCRNNHKELVRAGRAVIAALPLLAWVASFGHTYITV